MQIRFLGAAGNVTGSRFLLEIGKYKILVDCGLFQERDYRVRNWETFPVDPGIIDKVILTHAHIDHCGYLPKFVRNGFRGEIFCTSPTADIAGIALLDSAKVQEEDAAFKKRRHDREGRKGAYPELPLYTIADAEKVFSHFVPISYKEEIEVVPGVRAAFYDAGHILGAAMVRLSVNESGKEKILIFSGDIGRWNKPILCDPTVFEQADCVIMESTYGNRLHEKQEEGRNKLRDIICETENAGGNVVIPSFAIERTQELLYLLSEFQREGETPNLLVFVDSPMAINVTKIFEKYPEYFDKETKNIYNSSGKSPFDFPLLKSTRSVSESKAINHIKGTSVIMAGSGMCTGGRIKHHLAANIVRPESTIVFVGYQAKGTLGRVLINKPQKVRILGNTYPVKSRIEVINGFSAHADKNELFKWISALKKSPEKIFIVHGEEEQSTAFAGLLADKLKTDVTVPAYLETFEL